MIRDPKPGANVNVYAARQCKEKARHQAPQKRGR